MSPEADQGERTFRRWRDRYRDEGLPGLDDRGQGPSARRTPVAEIERMLGLYRDLYRSFTVKHFHEQLGKRHNYILGYTLTKVHLDRAGLDRAGLVQAAKKRSAHRKKRPRRPMVGMMLHQDASTHAWLPGGLAVFWGPHRLADYDAFGVMVQPAPPPATPRKPPRGLSLLRRWDDAVACLAGLQAKYRRWLEALPDATRDTATGEALQAIADLDLEEILTIRPPRGFGRD